MPTVHDFPYSPEVQYAPAQPAALPTSCQEWLQMVILGIDYEEKAIYWKGGILEMMGEWVQEGYQWVVTIQMRLYPCDMQAKLGVARNQKW
jgi:hypothetical protein